MIDSVRIPKQEPRDLDKRLADAGILDQLRKGNIFEVLKNLPTGVTKEDIEQFMREEKRRLSGDVVQDYEIKSSQADYPGVDPALFAEHRADMSLSSQETEMMTQGIQGGMHIKAMKAGLAKSDGNATEEAPNDDIRGLSEDTLQELDQFLNEVGNHIMDSQMISQLKQKDAEIQKEMKEIMALCKSGKIHPVFVLIALAKFYSSKSGILFTWKGKRLENMNEVVNRTSQDLLGASATMDYVEVQMLNNRTREGAFQMNMEMQDMQKLAQNIESVLSSVKSMSDLIFRAQDEMVRKVSA